MRFMRIPVAGGEPKLIFVTEGLYNNISCSRIPGGVCAISEMDGKATTVSLFDPIRGRGPRLFAEDSKHRALLSPDGKHFAYLVPRTPHRYIRITNLHGVTEADLSVAGVDYLNHLKWSADSSGFFTSDVRANETRLLHVERSGASQILWTVWR